MKRSLDFHGRLTTSMCAGGGFSDFNFHWVGARENMKGCDMGYVTLLRKQYIKMVDDALTQFEEDDDVFDALLAFRWALVQEGLMGIRKRLAAKAIQRSFREANTNPAYQLCKNRLIRESTEMAF